MFREVLEQVGYTSLPVVLFIAGLVIFVSKFVITPAYFSPLGKIPNAHPLAPLTSGWITLVRYRGQEFEKTHEAFARRGQIVRLGPKELAVNVIDGGIRTIYGRGFEKPPWYDYFINYGKRNTVCTLDASHGMVRRRVSSVYGKSFLQKDPHFKTMVRTVLEERLVPILARYCMSNAPVEMLEICFAYGIDMVSAAIFGLSCSTNFLELEAPRKHFLAEYLKNHPSEYSFWLQDVSWLTACLAKWGLSPLPDWYYTSRAEQEQWCLAMIDAAEQLLADHHCSADFQDGHKPIVYEQLRNAVAEEAKTSKSTSDALDSPAEQRLVIASECLDHLVATRDDLGITLASILHQISKHPECQPRFQYELLNASEGPDSQKSLPSAPALESLPYFNAVIKECLRLRQNSPTPNPRVTPPDGTTTLGPYTSIPPNTRVVAFARCLHRDERVFPDATGFHPERWLKPAEILTAEDEEKCAQVDECEQYYWTFGSGSRMCLASNMAMEVIRAMLAVMYLRFSTTVVEDVHFGLDGGFVKGSAKERLLLRLISLDAQKLAN